MKRWLMNASIIVVACSATYIQVTAAGDTEKLRSTPYAFDFGAQDLTAVISNDPRPVRFRGPIHEIDAPLVLISYAFDFGAVT